MADGAIAGATAIADSDLVMPGDPAIADMECSAAGNGSLTVILMTSASGRNRYHSAAAATTAVATSKDLRGVMFVFLPQCVRVGARRTAPSGCQMSPRTPRVPLCRREGPRPAPRGLGDRPARCGTRGSLG